MADVLWSVAAMTMVPTAQTIRDGKYETTAGGVKFRVGESGSISFVSPITRSLRAGRYVLNVHIVRTDKQEPIEGNELLGTTAEIRRRSRGNVTTVIALPGDNFDGVEGGVATGTPHNYVARGGQKNLPDGIDVDTGFYWLQLKLQQEGPASEAKRNAVSGISLVYYGA